MIFSFTTLVTLTQKDWIHTMSFIPFDLISSRWRLEVLLFVVEISPLKYLHTKNRNETDLSRDQS